MADNSSVKKEYSASSIKVMEGLEAVRKRPAMYIGSTGINGLHHLVYEVVDNSVDEALAGHCDTITVRLHPDGSCSVEDNGRGIPTDIHPTEKISAAEVVLTKLHAGGKFDKDSYKFSGGLHGVGISVVNALSEVLYLTIYQNGFEYRQTFHRGKPDGRLEKVGPSDKHGTTVRFLPDAQIFQESTEFSFETLSARLRELAFLNKKLSISIIEEATDKKHDFFFEGGIVSFVDHINKKKSPISKEILSFEKSDDQYVLEVALQYNEGYGEQLYSFVNNINTVEGGTHVSGFKSALTKICNKKATEFNILKGEESFSSEDVREGLVCVISMKVPEPQFEGQTKTKLGNNEVKGIVDSWSFSYLDSVFEENPTLARKILQKAEVAKRAREAAKKARDLTRRKTVMESIILPGKLADCTDEDPSRTELFIVEGDSAGGSAKQGRDRNNQAILPLRGKILNVEKARLDKILSSEQIQALIAAIGCGIGKEFNAEKARYHKIILMTDADVDGLHIRTLLLTFFFRHMTELIDRDYIYIAQPPLYKVKIGRTEQYLKDSRSFEQFLYTWAQENTQLFIDDKEIPHSEYTALLLKVQKYSDQLNKVSMLFRISADRCHPLATALRRNPWKPEDGIETLIENLRNSFKEYKIESELTPAVMDEENEVLTPEKMVVSFTLLATTWTVPVEFFNAEPVKALIENLNELHQLEDNQWTLKITDKERLLESSGSIELFNGIKQISKPYMHVQRYKGLGEMNPEQLWETAMDKKSRTLLRVTVKDALEADRWFTTLMGDDVIGRRDYILKFGQFVKNLDV